MRRRIVLALLGLACLGGSPRAQLRVQPVDLSGGDVRLGLLLRTLRAGGVFMMTTAHPDDENNALLAEMALGRGLRTVLVTATRGEGGQNEIGPELFDALAVLRSEELLAAHRFDGAEQVFTRASDFGYSFSLEETYEKWGRREILGDFVRHIRTYRPDVIAGFLWDGDGGGQHHQASSRLTAEAFRLAADPAAYPEQLAEGLRPWQPSKFYYTAGFGPRPAAAPEGVLNVTSSTFDPLLGRTYEQIGSEARSMHKCQGMTQLPPLWEGGGRAYKLHDAVLPGGAGRRESSMLDGVDTTLAALARFAGAGAPPALSQGLARITGHVDDAERGWRAAGMAAAVAPLAAGLRETRALIAALAGMKLAEEASYEIRFRLDPKVRQFEDAIAVAAGLEFEALADDPIVTPGQPLTITVAVTNHGAAPVSVTSLDVAGLQGASAGCAPATAASRGRVRCQLAMAVPGDAKITASHFRRDPDHARYVFQPGVPFGAPFPPTPFVARVAIDVAGTELQLSRAVEARYEGDIFAGEKRTELLVVPPIALGLAPDGGILPRGAAGRARELRVSVHNRQQTATEGHVVIEAPAGWTVSPARVPVALTREDEEAVVRFTASPPPGAAAGEAVFHARMHSAAGTFDQGYQVVEYPHTRRRHVPRPALATLKLVDVAIAPGRAVGYVMGAGDQVPAAIAQLGASVTLLTADDLAWGDLSRYDVIVTGIRAYERRADLRAHNHRLIEYAREGGVVLALYNKFEFNEAQYGPYPAAVGRGRVTDETSPVTVLAPAHPVFTTPNRLGPETWQGWVQERGLYFLGDRAPAYVDLIELADPFPYNAGPKRGALVVADVGRGTWVYVGLGLWRQLPAGVPGAYRLLANLLSLGATR